MLRDRRNLEEILEKKCEQIVFKRQTMDKITGKLQEKYNMPTGYTTSLITGRIAIQSISNLILYFLTDGILPDLIPTYFTEIERTEMQNCKYEIPLSIKLPLRIKVSQVDHDCWMGSSSASFFLSLYRAQLINYNSNTQRVMRRIIKNKEISYTPFLNPQAVDEIAMEFRNRTFIPNVLTLNIPEEESNKFVYDKDTEELVIQSLNSFDIIDGYHRLVAMCICYNEDDTFDYPMMVVITSYSEPKAKRFISQEDKKTHMRKIYRDSMNINLDSNYVVERLNTDMDSSIKGIINRNEGIIDYSELSAIVDRIYIKSKKMTKFEILKDLKSKWNLLIDNDNELISERFDTKKLYTTICILSEYNEPEEILKRIKMVDLNPVNIAQYNLKEVKIHKDTLRFLKEIK